MREQKIGNRIATPCWRIVCEIRTHMLLNTLRLGLRQVARGQFGIFGQFDPKDALWDALALLVHHAQHAEESVYFIGHGGGRTSPLDPRADEGLQIGASKIAPPIKRALRQLPAPEA